MLQSFGCPSCGAALEYRGTGRTVKCPYCGTVAQVPEGLWQPAERAQTTSQLKKWIILFLVITVVLPTCLGVVGTILGVGGGLLGIIVPFIVMIFGG